MDVFVLVKASCSIIEDHVIPRGINASDIPTSIDGTSQCKLFWPDLTKEVAKGVVHHFSSATSVLHNRPLKKGQVKVEIVTIIQGQRSVKVPFPTVEVSTLDDAIGQFIAWHDHLTVPIMESTNAPEV